MSNKNANQPAFPEPFLNDPNLALTTKPGLTKRELIAAMAMQGMCANEIYAGRHSNAAKEITSKSIQIADELLTQLNNQSK